MSLKSLSRFDHRRAPHILHPDTFPAHLTESGRGFQGIPGITGTPDGRLWAAWYGGGGNEGPDNAVFLASREEGETGWTMRFAVDAFGYTRCFDPVLWTDEAGRLWLFWAQALSHGRHPYVWAIICEAPGEEAPCWSEPIGLCPGVMMNKPTVTSDGSVLLPVSNWKRLRYTAQPVAETAEVYRLDLQAREAVYLGGAASAQEVKCYDEAMIIELRDGRLRMDVRTRYGIGESFSTDGGRCWTEITPSPIVHTNSRFFIRRLASGSLLLIKHGGAAEDVGRTNLTALISDDDGESWTGGLLLDERAYASYPDGWEDAEGRIRVVYDLGRHRAKEILMATFREDEVRQGRLIHADSALREIIDKATGTRTRSLLPAGWSPLEAANEVLSGLVSITPPEVKGAHDAEMVLVGDHAYIVAEVNDLASGESDRRPEIYCSLTIVHTGTGEVEAVLPFAASEQVFENVTLPVGTCYVPRILRKDDTTLRCYFTSTQPDVRQSEVWYRDFDLAARSFAPTLGRVMLKTAEGTFPMQPRYFHADAARTGFSRPAKDSAVYIFDSFKLIDGKRYVVLNNFPGRQNALALVCDDLATFEIVGHYHQPETMSESAVQRLPSGHWMAIARNESPDGNYLIVRSEDGIHWSEGAPVEWIPNGTTSKPTFDCFGGVYYLGWQEATQCEGAFRSVFNIEVSRDGENWERKYRFESPHSFQYPSFHEHEGAIWLCVTQGDHSPSRKERIMFGKLEEMTDSVG